MDNQSKPCALSSFMKLLRAKSLSNVNEIVIVDDNAKRRRSSITRLGHALRSGKCRQRRSFRKSQRWESQQATMAVPPSPSSSLASHKSNNQEEPVRRRCSGILCPQRRASVERRYSIESQTSISSSASLLSVSERLGQEQQQELPAYELALQLIGQKYATQPSTDSAPNSPDISFRSMGLTPPMRRPSYGDICGTGARQHARRKSSSGIK